LSAEQPAHAGQLSEPRLWPRADLTDDFRGGKSTKTRSRSEVHSVCQTEQEANGIKALRPDFETA
jgi:hypothetical protein